MKIVIDNAIPFIRGVFEPYCQVEYIDGKGFNRNTISGADALIIRTRTICNNELLEGSSVRHIATATIGFDHIDTQYCAKHGIEVSTAAGCNARGVLQWVGALLVSRAKLEGWQPSDKTLGVVGVGNVGSLVSQYAQQWGFKVLCCDPPRQAKEGGDFVSFEHLAAHSDIITFHTPLDDSTRHLICDDTLRSIKRDCLIVNSSRGEVIDTAALLKSGNPFALDVWESEPNLNHEALEKALIATSHIAGYSLQGKANATIAAVHSVSQALNLPLTDWESQTERVTPRSITWEELCQTIDTRFDIKAESSYLKSNPEKFEEIRNNYDYRTEYF